MNKYILHKTIIMADIPITTRSARSRAPLDEASAHWWEHYGLTSECGQEIDTNLIPKEDKSTTSTLNLQRDLTVKLYSVEIKDRNTNPKDIVLKKWRKAKAQKQYEQARLTVINSLKEKFGVNTNQTKINHESISRKDDIGIVPKIVITEAEDISDLNVNSDKYDQDDLKLIVSKYNNEDGSNGSGDSSHARKLQMGQGGELAQWRIAPRGSRAAGAEGGIRGLTGLNMPVSFEFKL